VWQCVAVCCSMYVADAAVSSSGDTIDLTGVLQCVAVCYDVLQCAAVC